MRSLNTFTGGREGCCSPSSHISEAPDDPVALHVETFVPGQAGPAEPEHLSPSGFGHGADTMMDGVCGRRLKGLAEAWSSQEAWEEVPEGSLKYADRGWGKPPAPP